MSKHWQPTVFEGAQAAPRRWRPEGRPWGWEPYRYRSRGTRLSAQQWVAAVAGGAMLGIATLSATGNTASAGGLPLLAPWSLRVIDGDTFDYGGERIRIAGIDAPEMRSPRCAYEAELGERATRRLGQLLRAGQFELLPIGRDADVHGRKLRDVTRNGKSIGDVLIAEGLARPYGAGRRAWCKI
jgi:endonuclease YncB( thermonuclease family)